MQALLRRLGFSGSTMMALGLVAAVLPGLALANPALGFLGGAIVALVAGVNPIQDSAKSAKMCLQVAIVLLGFTLNLGALLSLSSTFSGVVTGYVVCTFLFGLLLAKVLRIDVVTASLFTIGTAICGGTAIAAAAPFFKTPPAKLGLALGAVFLLNMVALIAFPQLGIWLGLSQLEFGAFSALAVHDTSSVVATAAVYGDEAAEVATTVKLGRTLWLIPVVVLLGMWKNGERGTQVLRRIKVPMFVLLFVLAAGVATLVPIPSELLTVIKSASKILLVLALFLVGLELTRETLSNMAGKDGLFAVLLWLMVIPVALFSVMAVT